MLAVVAITSDDTFAFAGTGEGVKVQVAPLGNPEHVRLITAVASKFRVKEIVALAELPATTIPGESVVAEIPKLTGDVFNSTPMPLTPSA